MSSTRAIALKALRAVDSEVKFVDVNFEAAVSTTPSTVLLNLIPQGSGPQTRIGNTCKLHSVKVRFTAIIDPLVAATRLRVLIVIDKQPNGVFLTLADLLSNTAAGSGTMLSPPESDSWKRVRILRDHLFLLTTNVRNLQKKTWTIRLTLQPRFVDAAAGIANIETGALLLFMISDQAVNAPIVSWSSRLKFVG